MIDLKWLADNRDQVKQAYARKGLNFAIDRVIELNKRRHQLQVKVDDFRSKRNDLSNQIANARKVGRESLLRKARVIKKAVELADRQFNELSHELSDLTVQLHNIPHESVPAKQEGDRVEQVYGQPPKFNFKIKDHLDLGKILDVIDVERAAKVSGPRFNYLKNEAVVLQFGLVRWVLDKLIDRGFVPVIPPVLVKEETMFGTGFFPAEPNEYFKIAQDQLYLAGTAEVPLASYHANETLPEDELPKKYAGYSTCFRREAGSYGQDTHGIIRVHQFDKVEQFIFAHPDRSWQHFEELANNSEEIFTGLEIPFRKVTINAGDLGAPNVKKYDFEAWLPSQNTYRELASCSHDTDFQARRMGIRYKDKAGRTNYVHTLNNTAIAIGRTMVVIIENHQQKDGSVKMPKVLHRYLPFGEIRPKLKT